MKELKVLDILKNFTDIVILQVDGNADIIKEILNTKEGFDCSKAKNIYDLFVKEDWVRIDRLFKMGADLNKKYIKLSPGFGIKEFTDVEVRTIDGEIYLALKFFDSNREREISYDRHMEEFAQMAELDPLTGLLNRYGYWERVKTMLNCGDPERKLGILLVDMDGLKGINDKMGHKAGDKAISQISNLLSSSIRKRDVGVRWGGDEFVLVVEEMTGRYSSAVGLGNRIIKTIKENKKDFLTTVSIGVHVVEVGDFDNCKGTEKELKKCWDKAVEKADEMAFKAKEGGRNRLVFSGDFKD